MGLLAALPLLAASLFQYKGKTFSPADLTPAQQQAYFDLEQETFARQQAFADQAILDTYFAEGAKAAGKDEKDFEAAAFKTTEPTEKEINDWFESNKGRLPPGYKLEQIKPDIKNLLMGEQKKKARDELLAKLKKDGTAKVLAVEPEAPLVKIDTMDYPAKGSKDAKLTLVEFADYQCPHCRAAVEDVEKILKEFSGKVKLVFMDFPINQSGISTIIAHGAYCADKQGKYYEYHDLAYEQQKTLEKDSPQKLAKELKLDEKAFTACLSSTAPNERVAKAQVEGRRVGVNGTPTIFLNGRKVRSHEQADLKKAIEKALKGGV